MEPLRSFFCVFVCNREREEWLREAKDANIPLICGTRLLFKPTGRERFRSTRVIGHSPHTLMKRPPIREDLKVMFYQSQEADNTFITSDGTSPYSSAR
jgi:hypothetical protein